MRGRRRTIVSVSAFAMVLTTAIGARADKATLDQCASASENAQLLRLKGRLTEARAQLLTCSRPACPGVVRKDCDRWLSEVDEMLPSVIFKIKDENDHDLVHGQVTLDGAPLPDALAGRAVLVDPGTHQLVVIAPNNATLRETLIIRESEKRRSVELSFKPKTPRVEPLKISTEAAPNNGTARVVGWSLLGLGAVAVLGGTFFAFRQGSLYSSAEAECKPMCALERKDDIDRARLFEGVAFGIAGAAVIGSLVLLLTHPTHSAVSN